MNQDAEHLRLLSLFHYLLGALTAVFSLFPLLHAGFGIAMVFAPEWFFGGDRNAPRWIGWIFAGIALAMVAFGGAISLLVLSAGRFLARRRHRGFCLVVAGIECLAFPMGTVLGVLTLLVLLRPSVERLFGPGDGSGAGPVQRPPGAGSP